LSSPAALSVGMAGASQLRHGSACAEKIAYGTNYGLVSCSWCVTSHAEPSTAGSLSPVF
jgi:hypothetical protein